MMGEVERIPLRWLGSRWFSRVVSVLAILVLVLFLFARLTDMEKTSERLVVDVTLRNIQTGMYLALGEAAIEGRAREPSVWVGRNPVDWLATPPATYLGDCPPMGGVLAAGAWCFDAVRRELVYRTRYARQIKFGSGHDGSGMLRWKVVVVQPGNGLRVELVTPFSWEEG